MVGKNVRVAFFLNITVIFSLRRYISTFFFLHFFGHVEPKLRPKKKGTGTFFRVVMENTLAKFHFQTLLESGRQSDFRESK